MSSSLLSVVDPQFLLCQHSKLEQMIDNIIFLIVNNILNFSSQPPHKNDKFYPQSPHIPLHESYPFITQHNNPGQTYPPDLSVAISYVNHVDKKGEQIFDALLFLTHLMYMVVTQG
jgi:hypothetical protein